MHFLPQLRCVMVKPRVPDRSLVCNTYSLGRAACPPHLYPDVATWGPCRRAGADTWPSDTFVVVGTYDPHLPGLVGPPPPPSALQLPGPCRSDEAVPEPTGTQQLGRVQWRGEGQEQGRGTDGSPGDGDGAAEPLAAMDLFAGCGGLSEGFEQVSFSNYRAPHRWGRCYQLATRASPSAPSFLPPSCAGQHYCTSHSLDAGNAQWCVPSHACAPLMESWSLHRCASFLCRLQSGVARTRWAIEYLDHAAKSFAANHPEAAVFCDNVNVLLKVRVH